MTEHRDAVLKMYVLRLGFVCVDEGAIAPGVADGMRMHLPIMSYLLKLANGEPLLVDTGIHRSHLKTHGGFEFGTVPGQGAPRASARVRDMVVEMSADDYIVRRLADLGVATSDIRYVINTHLHFDHAGNNGLFPTARFYVQRDHYETALDNAVFPNEFWNLGLDYELLDGDADLFPGVSVFRSPGHVPGHQSVLVQLPESNPMLLCGDAIFCADQLVHDTWGSHADPVDARTSAQRLQGIAAEHGASLIFGHDPVQGASLLRPPLYYV